MEISIVEETPEVLWEYEKISIVFLVETYFRLELSDKGLGGIRFVEEAVEKPFIKDYDAYQEDRPTHWSERFDLSNWGILSAFDSNQRVGGAAVAWKTPEVSMLDGRDDLACLWDLRVEENYRGKKIGNALFASALAWAEKRNCRSFKVETQNINVPACRFYVRQGCELGAINKYAYPEAMNEVQLIWYRDI
jgi:ribosomal protein S18 acetylase RimI-like enzyme